MSSSLNRRTVFAAGLAALVPVRVAGAVGYCDFEEFHPDPTGTVAADDAFHAWILAALTRGRIARAGPGIFRLAATHNFDLQGQHLAMVGAGIGRTCFRRAAASVNRNGEVLMRFTGLGTNAVVEMTGLTVDMNCDQQPLPPGAVDLKGNFAWQHCGAVEFLPKAAHAFRLIHIRDCEVRNPIADGFSIRGGPVPGVGDAMFERVVNRLWPIERKRPRVRGDITITAMIERVSVSDCVLSRLHYELGAAIPPGLSMKVVERGNRVGEILGHFPANYTSPERATRNVHGGVVARGIAQGNCTTISTGVSLLLRQPSRLTGGVHRFENCRFRLEDDYSGNDASPAVFGSSYPVASAIEVIGGRLEAAPNLRTPQYFIDRNGKRAPPGRILIDGLIDAVPGMELVRGSLTQIDVRNVRHIAGPGR